MKRIFCINCAHKIPKAQHPEDTEMGFRMRTVIIPHVKKPAGLHIEINGKAQPELPTIICDSCGKPIDDGDPAAAWSQWRRGEYLGPWEKEYGL